MIGGANEILLSPVRGLVDVFDEARILKQPNVALAIAGGDDGAIVADRDGAEQIGEVAQVADDLAGLDLIDE